LSVICEDDTDDVEVLREMTTKKTRATWNSFIGDFFMISAYINAYMNII